MTQHTYKTCPQCGQPAILQIPDCQRCGYSFPNPFVRQPASSGAPEWLKVHPWQAWLGIYLGVIIALSPLWYLMWCNMTRQTVMADELFKSFVCAFLGVCSVIYGVYQLRHLLK